MPDRFGHIPARRDHNTDVRRTAGPVPPFGRIPPRHDYYRDAPAMFAGLVLGTGVFALVVAVALWLTDASRLGVAVVVCVGISLLAWGSLDRRRGARWWR